MVRNSAGRARREQTLEHAAGLFAARGFGATSFREIAAACGLKSPGLSHHFADKTALLLELVRQREQQQMGQTDFHGSDWADWARSVERQNREVRAVTQLFAILSAEAIEPAHPAHAYFVERHRRLRGSFAVHLCKQRGDQEPDTHDLINAQVLIALWDGLQLQARLEPDVDINAAFNAAIAYVQRSSLSAE